MSGKMRAKTGLMIEGIKMRAKIGLMIESGKRRAKTTIEGIWG